MRKRIEKKKFIKEIKKQYQKLVWTEEQDYKIIVVPKKNMDKEHMNQLMKQLKPNPQKSAFNESKEQGMKNEAFDLAIPKMGGFVIKEVHVQEEILKRAQGKLVAQDKLVAQETLKAQETTKVQEAYTQNNNRPGYMYRRN